MRFGQTQVLKTAKGKIAVGLALILFGVVAILAAPTTTDKLLCTLVALAGAAFIALGIRQDRTEKDRIRNQENLKKEVKK